MPPAGEYRRAETITCDVADDSGAITRHDALKLVGERTVAVCDGAAQDVFGVAEDAPDDHPIQGEKVTVVLKGARNAAVSEGTTVSADGPTYLTSSGGTNGELRAVDGAGGESPQAGGEFRLLTDEEDGLALVLLR